MRNNLVKFLSALIVFSLTLILISKVSAETSTSNEIKRATVILDLESTPINGGINPEFKEYRITGKVLLGNNKCESKGISVKIKTIEDNEKEDVVQVKAYLVINTMHRSKICTREYMPVYEEFDIDVRAKKIIIHNVDRMGNDVILP